LFDCWAESNLIVRTPEEFVQDDRVEKECHALATQAQREDISMLRERRGQDNPQVSYQRLCELVVRTSIRDGTIQHAVIQ